jgi:hypothetical protein
MRLRKLDWIVVAICWCACLAIARPALAQPDVAKRIHALIVFDEKVTGAAKDGKEVEHVLHEAFNNPKMFPEGDLKRIPATITVLRGAEATATKVLEYYRELEEVGEDTLLFYYAGHGGFDQRGHHLVLRSGRFYREDLRRAMLLKAPRLTVILTDCCSGYVEGELEMPKAQLKWKVLYTLLGRHRGLVDITAATPGTLSFGDEGGGIFSRSMCHLFCVAPKDVGASEKLKSGYVAWPEFFEYLQNKTKENYAKFREKNADDPEVVAQAKLVPFAFALPQWRFGARINDLEGGGIYVEEVFKQSPAESAGMRPRQVIESVDGRVFQTKEEFADYIDNKLGGVIRIRVTGLRQALAVPLAW